MLAMHAVVNALGPRPAAIIAIGVTQDAEAGPAVLIAEMLAQAVRLALSRAVRDSPVLCSD